MVIFRSKVKEIVELDHDSQFRLRVATLIEIQTAVPLYMKYEQLSQGEYRHIFFVLVVAKNCFSASVFSKIFRFFFSGAKAQIGPWPPRC